MKIKKLPNTSRVIVEWTDILTPSYNFAADDEQNMIENMNKLCSRRTAYNMWEFKTEEDALHALLVLGLKL